MICSSLNLLFRIGPSFGLMPSLSRAEPGLITRVVVDQFSGGRPSSGPPGERMRKSRFSEEQKVKMVREAEQRPIAEVAKKHGVSVETLYRWRRAYGGMELPEVKRLKQLEQENARLKKLLAERDLEVEVMKEIAAKKW